MQSTASQTLIPDVTEVPHQFDICREGELVVVRTSRASVIRAQFLARLLCGLGALMGLGLTAATPWGAALALGAVAAAVLLPPMLRVHDLLELDQSGKVLRVRQSAAAAGANIPVQAISEIRGEYEVRGWDPQSSFQAVLQGGQRVPLLVFAGTDERLAREAGQLLADLVGCEVTYTGPDGSVSSFAS